MYSLQNQKEMPKDKANDYASVWNEWNDDTIEIVSVEKQTASEG